MDIALFAMSEQGMQLAVRVQEIFSGHDEQVEIFTDCPLKPWMENQFPGRDALIVIGSLNHTVHAIASFLQDADYEPAVLVMDDRATFCIPLIDGTNAAAEELSQRISRMVGCVPVLPRPMQRVFDVGEWAQSQHLSVGNPEQIRHIQGKLLAGMQVNLLSLVEIAGALPSQLRYTSAPSKADIFFTVYDFTASAPDALILVPPVLTLGIGCRRGTSLEQIERAVMEIFRAAHIHFSAVFRVCSTEIKQDEPGLLEFCRWHKLPFATYSPKQLSGVRGNFGRGEYVSRTVGVDNACERAALLGAGESGELIIHKTARYGVTVAAAVDHKLVEHYAFP